MNVVKPQDWLPQGVESLEDNAWEALRETGRSVLVTAGAGAGKTEFLAQKASYLLQTGLCPAPKRILAISFKRDAARNLAMRVEQRCGRELARRFNSFTFDAFSKNLVDRFRAAIPEPFRPPANYRITMPRRLDFVDFLERKNVHGLNAQQIEQHIVRAPLPFQGEGAAVEAVRRYWTSQYEDYDEVVLSFAMINRLALRALQENPEIRRGLHLSYPVIFLDEFQDTTAAQYEVLGAAFDEAQSVFTAVGDDKQRIMLWAGALPDAFDRFEADYEARRIPLISNWRSHEDLVSIQHVIARQIDPDVDEPQARGERAVDGDVAAIWQFDSEEQESDTLAAWIASEVAAENMLPHDAAVLVRMYANNVEEKLAGRFTAHGLRLRNVAREVGGISIQDIITEELTQVLLPLLRLGSAPRSPESWGVSLQNLQFLDAVDAGDDATLQRLQQRLQEFIRPLRRQMRGRHPDEDEAAATARMALEFIGEDTLRLAFPEYSRKPDFERAWNGFVALLKECTAIGGDWSATLDEFEGLGQVVLMTVHKSKGLEFHTMIFYGLDNQTWWSLTPQKKEELNSFFVAFTRARQRAFFTCCSARGQPVHWIEQLLLPAGLVRMAGNSLLQ
tara:strand:- start:4592 stop:6445 length:1854 start_codon:yes stop_codon:yes gene_type:complete